ncbi:hypothetical protein QYF36_022525 [Acer negundo]|nr:hypothetical protein QYF36_022525 [Acer negundo]
MHGMKPELVCPICSKKSETTLHALWRCASLKGVRAGCGLADGGSALDAGSFIDFILSVSSQIGNLGCMFLNLYVCFGGVSGIVETSFFTIRCCCQTWLFLSGWSPFVSITMLLLIKVALKCWRARAALAGRFLLLGLEW